MCLINYSKKDRWIVSQYGHYDKSFKKKSKAIKHFLEDADVTAGGIGDDTVCIKEGEIILWKSREDIEDSCSYYIECTEDGKLIKCDIPGVKIKKD